MAPESLNLAPISANRSLFALSMRWRIPGHDNLPTRRARDMSDR